MKIPDPATSLWSKIAVQKLVLLRELICDPKHGSSFGLFTGESMLMVVFGAGASYDAVPSRPPGLHSLKCRMPLANELFDDRPEFVRSMSAFPKCKPIIPYLQRNSSVEDELQRLQAEAEEYPERYRQLTAVRYYLQHMLHQCEYQWSLEASGITNYITLLDQIQRWCKGRCPVCLVTFNYDTMLETALPTIGMEIRQLSDYINREEYKLIKVHGSINWVREIGTEINTTSRDRNSIINEVIDRAPNLNITQRYQIFSDNPMPVIGNESVLIPALAIPVQDKGEFECPEDHLNALCKCIPQVTKLLTIGWRATEAHFLRLLSQGVQRDIRVMSVAGSAKGARETLTRLEQKGVKGQFIQTNGGFTDFVTRRDADGFLRS